MMMESKRHALEKLIDGCGTVVLSDLATVTKQNGQQMKLNVWIAGKKLEYHLTYNKIDFLVEEIDNVLAGCLERFARDAVRELYWK